MSRIFIYISLSITVFLTSCTDGELGHASTDETSGTSAGPTDDTTDGPPTGNDTTDDSTDDSTTDQPVDDGVWELRMPDFSPPVTQTWYACYAFTIPVSEVKHLTGFRPQVFDKHIHHYVVGMRDTPRYYDPNQSCSEFVDNMIWGWAPGGEELHLPDDVGIRVGDSGTVTFVVQIHYDNPLQEEFVDNSGFDVLYTNNLRAHEAGIFRIGDILGIKIPAGEPAHEHVSTCPSKNGITGGDINVIGTWLHAHEIGSKLWTEVYREGAMVGELGREDPFLFDYQTFRPLSMILKPGDELQTHCVYDASDRDVPTYGGEATNDEMCINFLLYYPHNPNLVSCGLL